MLTGNSQDFQKLTASYFDPQTGATAGSVNKKLWLLLRAIFPVLSFSHLPASPGIFFPKQAFQSPPWDHKCRPHPHQANAWSQLGWGQFFGGLTWRWARLTQRIRAIFAPPAPGKGSTSKPYHHVEKQPQQEAEKKDGARQRGNAMPQEGDIGCSASLPQLNSRAAFPGWAGLYLAVKSNKSFLLLSWALACDHGLRPASSSPSSPCIL